MVLHQREICRRPGRGCDWVVVVMVCEGELMLEVVDHGLAMVQRHKVIKLTSWIVTNMAVCKDVCS